MYRIYCLLLFTACSAGRTLPSEPSPLPLIVDADTANEVDDLFALVRAVVEPGFDLRGITAAQFHTSPLATDSTVRESQDINEELLRLLDRTDLPHPIGANGPLPGADRPADSPAARFIVEQALGMPEGERLHVAILGSCTNVASAILLEPRIVPKLSVHYLGFWHTPATNQYVKREFNSGNDTLAVNLLLDTEGLAFEVMTATTSQQLVFNRAVVEERLKGHGGVADYLVDRWDSYTRWWTTQDPEKAHWIMWDVALIEALARPELATRQTFRTPPENTQREIGIYTAIDTAAMQADFWARFPGAR